MRDLRYGVKDLANKSANSVGEYAHATTRYVSEQPLKSALIAAAVGAAVAGAGAGHAPPQQQALLLSAGRRGSMVHPIFSVLVTRPELVMDHVAGYAALVQEEASSVGNEVAKRAIAWGVAVLALFVFLVLAGVAVMLGAMQDEFHWVLVLVPATALLVSLGRLERGAQAPARRRRSPS